MDDGGADLGRVPLAPQIGANDVAELDLGLPVEAPAVDAAAADERAVWIAEHPDAEPVLAPVRQLAGEPLAHTLRVRRLRAEGREHALVAVQRVQVVEVRLGERKAAEAPALDQVPRRDQPAADCATATTLPSGSANHAARSPHARSASGLSGRAPASSSRAAVASTSSTRT